MYLIDLVKRIRAIKGANGSIIKSIIYNWKYLPFKQSKFLPLVIGKKTKIKGTGRIVIADDICMPANKIYIGLSALNWAGGWETLLSIDGKLFINGGHFFLGSGSSIEVSKGANLICDDRFNVTGKSTIICKNQVHFSTNTLISWDTLIMDTDSHTIISENGEKNKNRTIHFGENTWICAKSSVLSGTKLAKNTVIGCGSIVKGTFEDENVVLAGNPAKIVKKGIDWSTEAPTNI